MTREPDGLLKHPFVVPGSQSYSDSLWDWDSWLANIAIRQIMEDNGDCNQDFFEYEKGCILNFLEHTTAEGKMPIFITPNTTLPELDDRSETNIHKPCIAQHAAFIIRENGEECDWIRPCFSKLERFIDYYMSHMLHKETGLFFWQDDMAIGVDNDPSIFYRPDKSIASIYLNCMMYKELTAMAYLCKLLGMHAGKYQSEAEQLKRALL